MRHLAIFVSVAALLPALAINVHARPQGDAASCSALAGRSIAPNTKIESAEFLADDGTVGTTKITVPF